MAPFRVLRSRLLGVVRPEGGLRWVEDLRRDFRHTVRSFTRNPGFATVVVLTLGLGIGATTAVFSVVNAVVLRPLNAPHAERLVRSFVIDGQRTQMPSPYTLRVWKDLRDVFEDVSAHRLDSVPLLGTSEPEQISVGRVSEPFFRLFGAPVIAGRTFSPDEDRTNGPAVAVLSYGLWVRRFGGDASVVGQTVPLGSVPHTVVGIIGRDFDSEQFEVRPDVWVPLQADPDRFDGGSIYQVTARLRPGVTVTMANAALAVEHSRLTTPRDGTAARNTRSTRWIAEPLQTAIVGTARSSLNLLLGAVAFLLLIACANVANLLLVRAETRKREMAIRAAIGAGRRRLVRQLLVESLVLSVLGGAVGLALSVVATPALLRLYPGNNPFMLGALGSIPRIGESGAAVSVDWRVLAFALLISIGTGVCFGLMPSRHLGRSDVNPLLHHSTIGAGIRGRRLNARAIFVVVELALAVILVIGASLLILTSLALRRVDPGFDSENVITMRMAVSGTRFETRAGISELARAGVERVQAIPGVVRASTTCCMPLETVWQLPFVIASRSGEGLTQAGRMTFHGFGGWTFVSPGYFDVFGIPILKGRDFSFADDANAPGVVIINEAMARRYWPTGDPLNDQLIIGRGMRPAYDEEPIRRIVGIVGNVRDTGLRDAARPAMYVPMAQEPDGVTIVNVKLLPIVWIARTATDPHIISGSIESALESSIGQLPVTRIRALTDVVSESTARTRFNTWLMTAFGFCALGLAAIGVYGLVTHWVQQRSREIGVRLALGAAGVGIATMVVRQGMSLAAIGVGIGIVGALGLAQAIRGLLFGVPANDPIVFGSIALLLSVVALIAVSIPAWRASRIDPLKALRIE